MKQGQLKSILILSMMFIAILSIAYAAFSRISLNYPSNEWVLTSSVPFNFTVNTTSNSISYCVLYANNSGSMAVASNYTDIINATIHTSGVSINNSIGLSLGWNVTCNNGSTEFSAGTTALFGVDANPPSISLDSPASGVYIDGVNNTLFQYTPTEAHNPDTCQFYTNISGTWRVNQTNASYVSGTQISVNISFNAKGGISDKTFVWGVGCNDSASNLVFTQNRSFTVDTIFPTTPSFSIPANLNQTNNTLGVSWSQITEANFDRFDIVLSPYFNASDPTQTSQVTAKTTNTTVLTSVPDGSYFVQVRAFDLQGHSANSSVRSYIVDTVAPLLNLSSPSNNSFLSDNTPDFNLTMVDVNPAACTLLLSAPNGSTLFNNLSINTGLNTSVLTNGTTINITAAIVSDGNYQYTIECNDTVNHRVNASGAPRFFTIDTVSPTAPSIISSFHQTNSTNKIPELKWNLSTESNFSKYQVQAKYELNGSVAFEVNVTSKTKLFAQLNLTANFSYVFNVTTYDLAGNTNSSGNTSIETRYFVDPVCGILNAGWNLCGAVWTTPKNLSVIGAETSATFVAIWNMSNHAFATCNYAVSASGVNCNLTTGIATYHGFLSTPSGITNKSTNVSGAGELPRGNYSYRISAIYGTSFGVISESLASPIMNITVNENSNATFFQWSAVTGAQSYRIYNSTSELGHVTFFTTNTTSFNHTNQAVHGVDSPKTTGTPYYIQNDISPSVWVYVNSSTDWNNRTWVAVATSANITLTNSTNGWNIAAGYTRNGRVFGHIKNTLLDRNTSLFSLPYNNGSSKPYVNNGLFKSINNGTNLDYGRAMWVFYNSTGTNTWDIRSW